MGWDATRPVPWRRLMKEWVIYAGIMTVVFALLFRDGGLVPILGGLFVSGPLYLVLGAVMAKFGYQRKTLADLRTPRAASTGATSTTSTTSTAAGASGPVPRPRPAPTRRTAGGPNRPGQKRRR